MQSRPQNSSRRPSQRQTAGRRDQRDPRDAGQLRYQSGDLSHTHAAAAAVQGVLNSNADLSKAVTLTVDVNGQPTNITIQTAKKKPGLLKKAFQVAALATAMGTSIFSGMRSANAAGPGDKINDAANSVATEVIADGLKETKYGEFTSIVFKEASKLVNSLIKGDAPPTQQKPAPKAPTNAAP